MKGKTYIIAVIVFLIGVLMLFGSSYSLIIGKLVSKETYGFDVANFDVEFLDNKKISISGIPESDEDGLKNSKEFSFTVSNNSPYDVNYRLDIIGDNTIKMNDVIHYVYAVNNGEYSDVLSLDEYSTITQNHLLKVNNTDTYKIKIWLSLNADESFMNKSMGANISLVATQNEYKYATTVIEKLYNTKQDNILFTNKDYRYTKDNSPNYLWFNCQDGFTKGDDYCEKWQIIGSFLNKKENTTDEYYMLKIVSTKEDTDITFNNNELVGDYDESYIETYANGTYYDKLNNEAKKYIIKAKWNIGSTASNDYESSLQEEKKKNYYGNVGLLNVSDYLYIQNNSFIKVKNIFFMNKNKEQIYLLNDSLKTVSSTNTYKFLPCVYLRPDVSIISGDGSINNPYEITIKYPMNY